MNLKSLFRNARRFSLVLGFLYLLMWMIGYIRVWSFESELRAVHGDRGKAVEKFINELKPGQSAELVRSFQYARQGKTKFQYLIWYYDTIDEDSAVSNRGGPLYVVWIGAHEVTSVDKSWQLSHGDKFGNPLFYYPSVALLGLDATEDP